MKLITPPLVIEEDEPFKNDILGRKAYGQALLNLVTQSNDELVISLDGQWGEGKTTFVKMWQGLLNKENVPNIYIDAFANDFVDDAFIAVASAITSYADKHTDSVEKKKVAGFKETTKKIGFKLLSISGKAALNMATLGALSSIDIGDAKAIADIAKGVSEIGGSLIEEKLNSHSEDVKLLLNFRNSLTELSQFLGTKNGKPLVIIIDELDRCRPTYAVEVLEKIKHLFSVENVVFVLAMNKQQLEESIKSVYGQNIDAHTYLQKFITIETRLPKRTSEHTTDDIKTYCFKLMEQHHIPTYGGANIILNCVEVLARQFNLSLRQIEKIFTNISLFYALSNKDDFILPAVISFLSVMKVKYPYVYEKLLHRKIAYEEMCESTSFSYDKKFWLIKYLLVPEFELNSLKGDPQFDNTRFGLSQQGIQREDVIPMFIQKLSMFNLAHL
ncbi:MAG TPA: P-loop NTPase fold protein [Nitrosospira sp.]|nr:P-loop NTPase fold protein [Nitrosospira sp.]